MNLSQGRGQQFFDFESYHLIMPVPEYFPGLGIGKDNLPLLTDHDETVRSRFEQLLKIILGLFQLNGPLLYPGFQGGALFFKLIGLFTLLLF